MGLFRHQRQAYGSKNSRSERLLTLTIVTIIAAVSTILMLGRAAPELEWDEAAYAAHALSSWSSICRTSDFWSFHGHGPMMVYLAKLGQEVLPAGVGTIELRLRFFDVLVGSFGIGLLYWILRCLFRTSRMACTLVITALGYQWRDTPTLQGAFGLGAVMAFGALSMTYIIPAALCWGIAVSVVGRGWIDWDGTHFKISWSTAVMFATAALIVAIGWPPGVFQGVVLKNFWGYVRFPSFPTIVGDRLFEVTPRWAVAYWLLRFEAPILLFSLSVFLMALWRALRSGQLSSRHTYLIIFLAFFLATLLTAHIAGPRNMLQFIGMLCLLTGALFDEAFRHNPRPVAVASIAVVTLALLNLIQHAPSPRTGEYQALLKQNENRLAEKSKAAVFGVPILQFYAQQQGAPIGWELIEMSLLTREDAPLAADVKYVLTNSFIWDYMPPTHPMRRVVADHWKVVWPYDAHHVQELRLYENPQMTAP
jgi:hypothetical protein